MQIQIPIIKREKCPPSGLRSKKGNLKAKREICAKGNLKAKREIWAKGNLNLKREICPPSGLRSKKGNLNTPATPKANSSGNIKLNQKIILSFHTQSR